ncbi:S9 family peptidase [Evansella cellulosilytica]|uniref:WD40-like beta Propeller containing protein n=1 Tax=Evansella cellulosilytica (strain ATCC 21833 / DSM 2522 / FERM P-1141 / JCM 9156 / N-4) TaxID=649639 RepID=E6TR92_EVAC2|nr:S9 family peptidase [Evansella cellulosilytica]ADU30604.1 WD40-like beta Propeller containing protein [Evansella cellulosilytica DSM 2522]
MKRTLHTNDLYRFKSTGNPQLTNDNNKLIYVIQELDKEKDEMRSNIYLMDLVSGEKKQLTYSDKDNNPKLSPDGEKLAFISTRSEKSQIWILPMDGGEPYCIKTEEAVMGPLIWTSDSSNILYSANVFNDYHEAWTPYPGAPDYDYDRLKAIESNKHKTKDEKDKEKEKKKNEVKVISRFTYRFDGQGYFGHGNNHVFITAVPNQITPNFKAQGIQITTDDYDYSAPSLSPNNEYLVVCARKSKEADYEQKNDLWIIHLKTKKNYLLYDAPGPTSSPNWSPCGKFVSFSGHNNMEGASTTNDLWVLQVEEFTNNISREIKQGPLTERDAQNITRQLDRPIGGQPSDVGFKGGANVGWQEDRLLFIISDKGAGSLYELRLPSFEISPLLSSEKQSISSMYTNEKNVILSVSNPTTPQELYLLIDDDLSQITNSNDKILQEVTFSQWEKTTYKTSGNVDIDAWIIYPSHFKKTSKYPLVLLIHGGPHAAYGPTFMFLAQLLAAQGYIVYYTNPRGSETYGQKFSCSIDKNWGNLDYIDIMNGIDKILAKGFVNEKKMFVHGWSYGGYMSCWIATQTDRFKAICAGASVTNLVSGYGTSDITLADEFEYGGQPWNDYPHLMKHSPLGHVEKVKTPVMLMHGENDMRVAPSQTEEFFTALKRLKKEAIMIRYPDEFHGLSRPLHQKDRYDRLIAWFNYYQL